MSCISGKHKFVNSIESDNFKDPYYKWKYHRCFYCFKYRYEIMKKQREMRKIRRNKGMMRAAGATVNGSKRKPNN